MSNNKFSEILNWRKKEHLINARKKNYKFTKEESSARESRMKMQMQALREMTDNGEITPLWSIDYKHEKYTQGFSEKIPMLGNMEIFEAQKDLYAIMVVDVEASNSSNNNPRSNLFFLNGSFPPQESISGQQVFDFIVNNVDHIVNNELNIGDVKLNNGKLESKPLKAVERKFAIENEDKEKNLKGALKDSRNLHTYSSETKNR